MYSTRALFRKGTYSVATCYFNCAVLINLTCLLTYLGYSDCQLLSRSGMLFFQPSEFTSLWMKWQRLKAREKAPYVAMAERSADQEVKLYFIVFLIIHVTNVQKTFIISFLTGRTGSDKTPLTLQTWLAPTSDKWNDPVNNSLDKSTAWSTVLKALRSQ